MASAGRAAGGREKRRGRGRRAEGGAAAGVLARVGTELAGLTLLATSLLAALALATYAPSDPVLSLEPVANRAGAAGATIAGMLFRWLGWGSVVFVGATGWLGGHLLLGRGVPTPESRFWPGTAMLLVATSSLPPILDRLAPGRLGSPRSGALGSLLVAYEELLFSSWGALLVSTLLLVIGALSVTGVAPGRALSAAGRVTGVVGIAAAHLAARAWAALAASLGRAPQVLRRSGRGLGRLGGRLTAFREQRARRARARAERAEQAAAEAAEPAFPAMPEERSPRPARRADDEQGAFGWVADTAARPRPAATSPVERVAEDARRRLRARSGAPDIVDHELERRASPSQESFQFPEESPRGPFQRPDVSIFQTPPASVTTYDRESLLMSSRILEKKLLDFAVKGRVVRVHPGPVITMYEYEPASGIKVGKIVSLTDDLAMALRAISIRIIAPLPGKSVVGIEIPNAERQTVYIRSLLESEVFRSSESPLMVVMGKDIFGNSVCSDLARMPHLLVAGATGTGKSVFLNSFLCSLISRASPDELKLLLIDPKLLELSIYEGIPHLIADVVTAPKRAAAALGGIVRKMEERYQMMSAVQVRNVDQFNAKAREEIEKGNTTFRLKPKPGEVEGDEVEWCHLPYIVVVIDELADLMVLAAKDVEESLQRLAQMARAAGIHLVLATQRPSVDVLTGVIKANFPARVSFQVSSGTDSRTILDQKGAENLLGMGDMLFLPPGTSIVQRLHGPLVTEKEVAEIVAFLRDQGKPVYDEDLTAISREPTEQEVRDEDVDEMFDPAVAIVAETRNASISYIQRRLKIGYNRAARIIEQMELQGMVGPQEGTRPRTVFLRDPSEEDDY